MTQKVDRREFLRAGAAIAAVAAAGGSVAARQAAAPPAGAPPATAALPDALPAAFHRTRLQQAAEAIAAAKISHLIAVPGPDLFYLTGLPLERGERFTGLVVSASGPPLLFCPAYDAAIIEAGPGVIEQVQLYDDTADPISLLEKQLRKDDASIVAVSGRTWYEEFAPLHAELPKLVFAVSYPYLGASRQVKSMEELRLLEAAARLAQEAADSSLTQLREGMREDEVEMGIVSGLRARGAGASVMVQSGPRSLGPRMASSERRLAAGDPVVITCDAVVRGYRARVSRTAVLGTATGRMKLIQQTLREAQEFAFERVRPGVPASSVDQVSRAGLGKRGFLRQLLHPTGAGCGLEIPEPPYLSPGYTQRIAQGQVLIVGQGVYTPGEYGIRQEDVLVVTADGARWLTTPAASLPEI